MKVNTISSSTIRHLLCICNAVSLYFMTLYDSDPRQESHWAECGALVRMRKRLKSDSCEIRTHTGCPTNLAGKRLNHSAKLSSYSFCKSFKQTHSSSILSYTHLFAMTARVNIMLLYQLPVLQLQCKNRLHRCLAYCERLSHFFLHMEVINAPIPNICSVPATSFRSIPRAVSVYTVWFHNNMPKSTYLCQFPRELTLGWSMQRLLHTSRFDDSIRKQCYTLYYGHTANLKRDKRPLHFLFIVSFIVCCFKMKA